MLRISYTGSHAVDLIYSPDLNQVAPNTASYTDPSTGETVYGYAALTATPALRQQNLKFPNFAEVLTRNNAPSDKYEAFMIELNRRFAHGLSFTNSYTLSTNKTNALGVAPNSAIGTGGQGDNGANVNNIYDITSDMGNAYYDPRNSFISTLVYDLPFGRGKTYLPTPAAPQTWCSAVGMSPESPCSIRASGRLPTTRAACMTLRARTLTSAR